MCRKVELFDKRMVLGVIVTQIVPQMMQLKKFYHHQIEVNPLGCRNLRSIQPTLRHLIDFITVQHQVGCESVMLIKKDVLVLNEAVHAMLAVLTDKQRDLIHQQFVLGKTHQEIADDMGISRGSVTRAVNQALERIRRKFDFEAHYELAAGGLT